MEFITGKQIERRTFLRGMGASVALPFLDSMVPAGRASQRGCPGCRRPDATGCNRARARCGG